VDTIEGVLEFAESHGYPIMIKAALGTPSIVSTGPSEPGIDGIPASNAAVFALILSPKISKLGVRETLSRGGAYFCWS
jgi:hypothetical protein